MIRAAALLLALAPFAALAEGVEEPADYRHDDYRAPVPATIAGGVAVGPEAAHELWAAGVGFIDVMPRPPRPANLPERTIWRDKPRDTIPGAIWLPNVGYGAIAEETADYFRRGLEKATVGDKARPVVIFCLEDCWMSWNAAKRAIEWGYEAVRWMPEGTDGWALWDYPLERAEPEEPQPGTG
ncbi:MAG: PQQ-dependent catabolism-associated CXXCW motif protein [Pseudomonadota bacterium]